MSRLRRRKLLVVAAALAAGALVILHLSVRMGAFWTRPPAAVCSSEDRTIEVQTLATMGSLAALKCFGDATLTLEGIVRCTPLVRDGGPGGPSWLDPHSGCVLDEALALHGPAVTELLEDGGPPPPNPVAGRYRVRGHFDDPEARSCSMLPIGVSTTTPIGPPDPEAVLACRQMFVVTDVEPLPVGTVLRPAVRLSRSPGRRSEASQHPPVTESGRPATNVSAAMVK